MVDDRTTFEATETVVGADGKVAKETIRATYDGKPYPVEGSPHSFTVAMSRLPDGSQRMELSTPDGLHGVEICRPSRDLETLTCDETDTDRKGVGTQARSVYVRD